MEQESNRIYRYDEDLEFQELLVKVTGRTLIDPIRLYVLYQLAKQYDYGHAAEVGVYKGGSACILLKARIGDVDLFDTFEGLPQTDPMNDFHKEGEFAASLEEVQAFLSDCMGAHFYPGLFPDSAANLDYPKKLYSLVHVDVDIFKSVYDCLVFFYPRMVIGGVMVFDDYSFRSTPGAKAAIDEFLADKQEKIIDINTGQGLLIKL